MKKRKKQQTSLNTNFRKIHLVTKEKVVIKRVIVSAVCVHVKQNKTKKKNFVSI